jgi:hypothetical protein
MEEDQPQAVADAQAHADTENSNNNYSTTSTTTLVPDVHMVSQEEGHQYGNAAKESSSREMDSEMSSETDMEVIGEGVRKVAMFISAYKVELLIPAHRYPLTQLNSPNSHSYLHEH